MFIYRHSQDIEKSLDIAQEAYKHSYHSPSEVQISKRHQIVNSAFPRPAYDPSLNLLAASGQDLEIENLPIPAANVIVMVSTKLTSVPLMLILVLIMMLRLNCCSFLWLTLKEKTHCEYLAWVSIIIYHSVSHFLLFLLIILPPPDEIRKFLSVLCSQPNV